MSETTQEREEDPEMVCDELVGLVTDYLEGTLSELDRRRFEAHVAECEWCENYVEQTRAVAAALGRLGEEPAHSEVLTAALTAFRAAHGA
jgi:anti-sigma factor RsiW